MSSRTKTQTISNLGRKENSMLLNYTPVIAELLYLVGVIGAFIGLIAYAYLVTIRARTFRSLYFPYRYH